jgi:hypothetical protein
MGLIADIAAGILRGAGHADLADWVKNAPTKLGVELGKILQEGLQSDGSFTPEALTKLKDLRNTDASPIPPPRPQGIVYDGANLWVANTTSNNVTKLAASSGAVLGTFAAGTEPDGMAFDGANSWAANAGSNTVSKFWFRQHNFWRQLLKSGDSTSSRRLLAPLWGR